MVAQNDAANVDVKRCPQCGCDMLPDSLAGMCPDCLIGVGLNDGNDSVAEAISPPGAFIPPTTDDLSPLFPQLELIELLGVGGMGAVYKARQAKLDRLVALKIIRPEAASDATFAERFTREARTLAMLNHPNIVGIHDFGEVDFGDRPTSPSQHLYFFVMEYVDGVNLRQMIEGGELVADQALAVVPQVCEALQFAHDEGVVHRDIKPENILIDQRGRVKIADFGLAKLASGSANDFTLTATHQVMGTPRYMAPEQMTGSHHVDHRADIYSLGVVLYEMLTGDLPLGQFKPPSAKSAADASLDKVVMKTLQSEPEARYQNASDVKLDLESVRGNFVSLQKLEAARRVAMPDHQNVGHLERPVDFEHAMDQVEGPALAMTIFGAINVALLPIGVIAIAVYYCFTNEFDDEMVVPTFAIGIPSMALGLFILLGSTSMRRLGSYDLAFMGIVSAMIPLGVVWVFSLPFAIWARRVMRKPDVRDAFSHPAKKKFLADRRDTQRQLERTEFDDDELRSARAQLNSVAIVMLLLSIALIVAPIYFYFAYGPYLSIQVAGVFIRSQVAFTAYCTGGVAGILILLGSIFMFLRTARELGMIVAVVSMCPMGPGWVLSLPLGIWWMLVLRKPEVKALFSARPNAIPRDEPESFTKVLPPHPDDEPTQRSRSIVASFRLLVCILVALIAAVMLAYFAVRPKMETRMNTNPGVFVEQMVS